MVYLPVGIMVVEVPCMGGKRRMAGKKEGAARVPDVAARERLLKSAIDLFNRKGYAAASVREIVAAAGVSKPVLYYYFRSKEGIYLDIMREGFSLFDSILGATLDEEGGAAERTKRLSGRTLDLFREHIEVGRLMYAIYYGPPQGAPFFDFDAYHMKFQEAVRKLVEEGIRGGEFRNGNADDMMWAIIGAVNVAMEIQLCHPELEMDREKLGRVLDIIFAGIASVDRPARRGSSGIRRRLRGTGAHGRQRERKGERR